MSSLPAPDPHFRVELLTCTGQPQTLIWQAMHQDYCEHPVADESPPETEQLAGEIAVKLLLSGERGHYGPLEHPAISFNVIGFPHELMQQARTHRVGISFDVQSGRYTGQRVVDAARGHTSLEEVFYFRPVGSYADRFGKHYDYTVEHRTTDLEVAARLSDLFASRINEGFSEEQARGLIPYCLRQHFVVSFNARSLMHFLDLRAKADAQLEIRQLSDMLFSHFQGWMPQIAAYYEDKRLGKARLAP